MGKTDKATERLMAGNSDGNIRFEELCAILERAGFKARTRGSHHIFTRPDVPEILNLQPLAGGKSKPYQVKQVRAILARQPIP